MAESTPSSSAHRSSGAAIGRVSRVGQFPGPHADSLVEHTFEVQWGKWDKQAPTRLGRNGDNLQLSLKEDPERTEEGGPPRRMRLSGRRAGRL